MHLTLVSLSEWVPETNLFCSQHVKGQGHESQKHCRRCFFTLLLLVSSAEFGRWSILRWNKIKWQCSLSNAYTQRTVTSGVTRGWMARGSHSFTCHPHVYPRMEWAILHSFRKHSPDGVARARWRTSGSAYYSSIDLEKNKRLSWPSWLTLQRMVYPHKWSPSATGRAWDKETSPVKDQRSSTV